VHRDRVRIRVGLVEVHCRDVRANHVERVGLNLHLGVLELVIGVLNLLIARPDLVLHGELDVDEHVVLGLGLDLGVQLLDLQAHPARHSRDKWGLGLQPGSRDSHELPEPLDDGSLLLLDGEEKNRHLCPFPGFELVRSPRCAVKLSTATHAGRGVP